MSTIQPIQTRYAGHRFRSRLEARWAVFFDQLDIKWQYEPQGYVIDGAPYLPDFWLPGANVWVEVKGVLTEAEMALLVKAARRGGLPASPHADAAIGDGYHGRILLLGEVPDPPAGRSWAHMRLDVIGEHILACPALIAPVRSSGRSEWVYGARGAGTPIETDGTYTESALRGLTTGHQFPAVVSERPISAYVAARSARFEHGERP